MNILQETNKDNRQNKKSEVKSLIRKISVLLLMVFPCVIVLFFEFFVKIGGGTL